MIADELREISDRATAGRKGVAVAWASDLVVRARKSMTEAAEEGTTHILYEVPAPYGFTAKDLPLIKYALDDLRKSTGLRITVSDRTTTDLHVVISDSIPLKRVYVDINW